MPVFGANRKVFHVKHIVEKLAGVNLMEDRQSVSRETLSRFVRVLRLIRRS